MPTIDEITDDDITAKTDFNILNELEYFAKSIYSEFKDNLIKISIESRTNNGLGALVIDLDQSSTIDLDIAYYKIEDMTLNMIKVIGENKNYKNTLYFIFMSKGVYFVIEDHLK